jgi:hypothetical protein
VAPSRVHPERNAPRGRSDSAGYRFSSADYDENVESDNKDCSLAILITLSGLCWKWRPGVIGVLAILARFCGPRRTEFGCWSYLPEKSLDFDQNLQHDFPRQSIQNSYIARTCRDQHPTPGTADIPRVFRSFLEKRTAATGSESLGRRGLNRRNEIRLVTRWGTLRRQSPWREGKDGWATLKSDDIFRSGHR